MITCLQWVLLKSRLDALIRNTSCGKRTTRPAGICKCISLVGAQVTMHMIIYTLQATTCKCSYCCCHYTLCSPQYRLQAQVDTFVSATFHRFAYALYIPMSKTHLSRCLLFSHFLKLLNLLFL